MQNIIKLIEDHINFGISKKAWWERNQLVLLMSKIFPAHLTRHVGKPWPEKLSTIVCIHTQKGIATWHISDDQVHYFSHLSYKDNHWDEHTVQEKYDRLRLI